MKRTPFNRGWEVRTLASPIAEVLGRAEPWRPVVLPHDSMLEGTRDPAVSPATAYYPGGSWEYRKSFTVAAEEQDSRFLLEFDGVYRSAQVFVGRSLAGRRPYGYSRFLVDLTPWLMRGEPNEIRVEATAGEDSRWYSGAGIYREVHLLTSGPIHVVPDGLRVTTPAVGEQQASINVAVTVENETSTQTTCPLDIVIEDAAGAAVGRAGSPVTLPPGEPQTVRVSIPVLEPQLWSPETPNLYRCRVTLRAAGDEIDADSANFGIRTLAVDAVRGFQLNGRTLKLRGACIHHDNGVLGAATIARAEERRIELLKEAGFNAVRSAHHPMSSAMLNACDRLGMLVMDEAFDAWTRPKVQNDYSRWFRDWWQADLESMVAKDFNHPSVVMYSIGNEIPDVGRPEGAVWSRRLAECIRAQDPSRPITNGVNVLMACGLELMKSLREENPTADVSALLADFVGDLEADLGTSDTVTENTAESMAALDVVGYNYVDARYELDHRLFPNRVLVGSETFPPAIDRYWKLVREMDHVIGDFTWTGWDYLGEVGVGRTDYSEGQTSLIAPYPWLTAWCGDIDITGARRPISYYREIVFGLRSDPYIAVQLPEHHGKKPSYQKWSWTDSIASWSWEGYEGRPVVVEVYADADEVELLRNGVSLGRRPAGEANRFRAEFETTYEPGELVAVAYRGGQAVGRHSLRSASGPVRLDLRADRDVLRADDSDLAFVEIELVDADGTVFTNADRAVAVSVTGPAHLQALGSANPRNEESFGEFSHTTFKGRVLAVVRPAGQGEIVVSASAEGCDAKSVKLTAH